MSLAERRVDTKQLEVKLGVVAGSWRVTKSRRRKCKHAPEAEAIPQAVEELAVSRLRLASAAAPSQ